MFFHFRSAFPKLGAYWEKYLPYQKRMEVPAKTVLLEEGKISRHYIYIEKGCVRLLFNNNGVDQTVQFFFEDQGLSSFDSFVNGVVSQFTIETIEPSVVYLLPKKYVLQLIDELSHEPDFAPMMLKMSASRQTHYINEFLSLIRESPEERYVRLLREKPDLFKRVPQHYIASYLGVSKVHLSRIKSKVAKGKKHF